ncbi:hypothetical protein A2264_01145 [candidate division WWE3 bacterium RIFOXYA2_FULL_46_9]|uniref:Uncharacterized protein n=1 Tax=candidate division WWE3 bacterium RIFOXYA2_FULL_46_9 TaxID=1802636 RepID=A0A1F4VZA0_UNCKA|nr:MAG: hypothetical protein A2264_01145 [candidate division WWE3 bacterium RIFOXYA2_FULL_46_9]
MPWSRLGDALFPPGLRKTGSVEVLEDGAGGRPWPPRPSFSLKPGGEVGVDVLHPEPQGTLSDAVGGNLPVARESVDE